MNHLNHGFIWEQERMQQCCDLLCENIYLKHRLANTVIFIYDDPLPTTHP